ncbi:MAG: Fe3+-citrate ABC transporter substrate-binding protein, partial [Oscillospiraceae bacterium]|nr:Fe3+-citrate ABC transporter substrate-binding protein [Candidatus Equicaccousia limihippi]
MKKTLSVLLILSLLICPLFCGCSSGADTKAAATVTITDHLDQSVTLPSDISRIAVCDILPLPSVIAAFFNSADKIVAMSPASMTAAKNSVLSQIYPEILNADTGAIDGTEVNVEELLKLDPQVVFYNAASKELGKTLTKSGFNAVAVAVDKWDYNPVQTLNEWIALFSQIFPDSAGERAQKLAKYSEDKAAFVK